METYFGTEGVLLFIRITMKISEYNFTLTLPENGMDKNVEMH